MRVSRFISLPALCLATTFAQAQVSEPAPTPFVNRPAHWRATAERIALPGGERVGLMGAAYLVDIGNELTVGPGFFGAATGRHGGFSAIGMEAAWRHTLVGSLGVEVGLFAGGGGRSGMPTGGGFMLRPHVDVLWDFHGARAGLSYSQVRFPNGGIDSRQFGLVLEADTDFRFVRGDAQAPARDAPGGRSGLGFDRVQVVATTVKPRGKSRHTDGTAFDRRFSLAGLRLEQSLGRYSYWGIEAAGATNGGAGGYAEYFATLGAESVVAGRWLVMGARAGAGVGGGGNVDVGGGLLLKGGVYATTRLSRDLGITLEAGVTHAPNGRYTAATGSASLNWILDDAADFGAPARISRAEWSTGFERFDARFSDGSRERVNALVLKANRFLNPWLYLTAQAHAAVQGRAGGYTAGLVGAGLRVPVFSRVHVGAEVAFGGAGGGGVDNAGGALVQPSVYAGFDITPSLAWRVGAGRVKSWHGAMNAAAVDTALVYSFGLAGRGYH